VGYGGVEMKKWFMIIDVEKCEDCNNCFLSCKDEHVNNDFEGYSVAQPLHGHRWINIMRKERGQCPMVDVAYLPVPCMHCDNAPCINKANDGAVYKRDNGIVSIDPVKAKGQKGIVNACPYKAIWWNEEKNVPQKCNFCIHLIDGGWKETRCSQACPTGSLRLVYDDELVIEQLIRDENLEILNPEYKTKPRVYYKNLHRYLKCFIGGTVAVEIDGKEECAEGANVALIKDSKKIIGVVTDNYGDFKIDRLEENSGKYTLEITYMDHGKKVHEIDLKDSINVGTISL
jgi:Fe-S-cluster-containing dehydrogenase component